MSGSWMAFFEIFLVFGAVFGFGFYELWALKKHRRAADSRSSSEQSEDQSS